MRNFVHHTIFRNTFWLSLQRCAYWEDQQALIVSDLHFGKSGHFRKSGIAVPQDVFKEDLQRLFAQIQFYRPRKVIIVGDMFHSKENKEMQLFARWRNDIPDIEVLLVKGNHDILADEWYDNAGIATYGETLQVGDFCFTHDMSGCEGKKDSNHYFFSGHIHPGIVIRTGIRHSSQFPCFYFNNRFAVLPAFSKFTGLYAIHATAKDVVYAITDKALIKV